MDSLLETILLSFLFVSSVYAISQALLYLYSQPVPKSAKIALTTLAIFEFIAAVFNIYISTTASFKARVLTPPAFTLFHIIVQQSVIAIFTKSLNIHFGRGRINLNGFPAAITGVLLMLFGGIFLSMLIALMILPVIWPLKD